MVLYQTLEDPKQHIWPGGLINTNSLLKIHEESPVFAQKRILTRTLQHSVNLPRSHQSQFHMHIRRHHHSLGFHRTFQMQYWNICRFSSLSKESWKLDRGEYTVIFIKGRVLIAYLLLTTMVLFSLTFY